MDKESLKEKELSREYKFEGRIVRLRLDKVLTPVGNVASREIVEHPGGVGIVALTDEGEVYMEWQYRRPFDDAIYEIPAGKMEGDEDPLICAKRELEEEIGLTSDDFTYLGSSYASPGFCTEELHIYLAKNLKPGTLHRDPDEVLLVEKVKLETLVEKVMSGEIKDGKSIIGILKTAMIVGRI